MILWCAATLAALAAPLVTATGAEPVMPSPIVSSKTLAVIPLGFSPRGRFAYLVAADAGAAGGCYVLRLEVLDLGSDKKILSRQYDGAYGREAGSEKCPPLDGWTRARWREDGARIQRFLGELGISTVGTNELRRFPLVLSDAEISVSLVRAPSLTEDGSVRKPVAVVMRSSAHGAKTLGRLSETEFIDGYRVVGYVKSPDEKRLAVVLECTTHWEGESRPCFQLLGGSLTSGSFAR